jgi:sec-independent protein translocase protein TatB
MLGVGWTEMLLIGVVALIVIGPKDLPMLMGRLGKMMATVRRMGTEFQREINKSTGLDQIADLRKTITEPLRKTADEIKREFNRTTATGVEPSGVIKPSTPGGQSVVDEIHAKVGLPAPAMSVAPVESPAPVEAIAPVKPKRVRKAAAPASAEESAVPANPPRSRAPAPGADAVVATAEVATPKPRATRAAKPKAES